MQNRVCQALGIEKPVLAASMNWLSDAEWAAAVSNAGGLGNLGFNCGQTVPTHDLTETIERFRNEIRKTRELTDKPFSVTYFLPVEGEPGSRYFADPFFEMMCEERVEVVYTNSTTPLTNKSEIERLKSKGFKIVHRDVNPTLASLAFAEASGADVLIATGFEAGGHMTRHRISLLSLFQEIRAQIKVPMVAGGGICNVVGAKAAAAMGAEGVYVGTRLLVTEESPASDVTKQAIIAARAEDLIEFQAQIGYLRATRSEVSENCKKLSDEGVDSAAIAAVYQGIWRDSMLLGDLDKGFLSVSDAINAITDVKTCKDVVDELASAF